MFLKKPYGLPWLALSAVFLSSQITTVSAQSRDQVATGLARPNLKQLAEMSQTMMDSGEILPNQLALDRLNAERLFKRVPTSFERAAPMGSEVLASRSSSKNSPTSPSSSSQIQSGKIPGIVDNSALKCFPPIRNQQELGSCAAFSAAYYIGTHMLGLARGSNAKGENDDSAKLSPKFPYNFLNSGMNVGTWPSDIFDVMIQFGVPSWEKWPYSGENKPINYKEWPRTADIWREATNNRFEKSGLVGYIHTANGLRKTKELLANGYVLAFMTNIFGWQYKNINNDPTTNLDDSMAGKKICWMVTKNDSGHVMTIVGYNDHIWVDINSNGKVDKGEKGAFKVANSWGPNGFGESGFGWLAYDAILLNSNVPSVDNSKRTRPTRGEGWYYPIWFNEVYWITARRDYSPKLLAEFTLNHSSRNQISLRLATAKTGSNAPKTYSKYVYLNKLGGPFAFDGGDKALDGTFVLDFTDFYSNNPQRYFLSISDTAKGSATQLKNFSLTSPGGSILGTATYGIPSTIDQRTSNLFIDFGGGLAPKISSPKIVSAQGGQSINLAVSSTNVPATFSATGLPPGLYLSDPSKGIISGIPRQAGSFTTTLSAANGSGISTTTIRFDIAATSATTPSISSPLSVNGQAGMEFKYQITAINNPSYFGASGLPPGLTFNKSTGLIYGKPSQAGVSAVAISAANQAGAGSQMLTIDIKPTNHPIPEIISDSTLRGTAGAPFTYRIEATNKPTVFEAEELPPELEINQLTGVISGTLPSSRVCSFNVKANNIFGSGSKRVLLTISGKGKTNPYNDNFASGGSIIGAKAIVCGTNKNATCDPFEKTHAKEGSNSVWWTWISPRNSKVTFSTAGSDFDTVLSVYSGNLINQLQLITENNNINESIPTSQVEFMAQAGMTYHIAIAGAKNDNGNVLLSVEQESAPPPKNDDFKNSIILTGNTVQTVGSNFDATSEENESQHMDQPASKSVWWSWTSSNNGYATVDTVGSSFDTVLAIYQNRFRPPGQEINLKGTADFVVLPPNAGNTMQLLSKIAEDDQGGENNTSKVTFATTPGTTYHFAVDGRYGSGGAIKLNITSSKTHPPKNDDFLSAERLLGSTVKVTSDTSSASAELGEPMHFGQTPGRSVWWHWTPDITGPVRITTAGSNFDTILATYIGSTLGNLRKIASNDDSAGNSNGAVEFQAIKGNVYYIAVDGHDLSGGHVALQITQSPSPLNDQFANKSILFGNHVRVCASNVMATTQDGEQNHAGGNATKSLWWSWKSDYTAPVRISTDGSDFDSLLAVYSGSEFGKLKTIVSNNNTLDGKTSTVWFNAEQGVTYQIAVAGESNASGSVELSLEQVEEGVIYQTDFNYFPLGNNGLSGIDGWSDSDSSDGSSGIRESGVEANLEGWIGYNKPRKEKVILQRITNVPKGSEIVEFGSDVNISDSTQGRSRDSFAFEIKNIGTQSSLLAGILFNNSSGKIFRLDGNTQIDTGIFFNKGEQSSIDAVLNLKENRWSAYHNGKPLFVNQILTSTSFERSVGSVDIVWKPTDAKNPGDNLMAFDNYYIATTIIPPSILSSNEALGSVGKEFTYKIESTDSHESYQAFDLPDGLICNSSTGIISGKPLKSGTSLVMLTAKKGDNISSKMLTIRIK
jgi:hypothetical protein